MNDIKLKYLEIITEDLDAVKFKPIEVTNESCLSEVINELFNLYELKSERDNFIVKISDNTSDESVSLDCKKSLDNVIHIYNKRNKIKDEDEMICFELEIYKECLHYISVYSIQKFKESIFPDYYDINNILKKFENWFEKNKCKYELILDKGNLETQTFVFIDRETKLSNIFLEEVKREELYELLNENCNYIGDQTLKLIPDDFSLVECSENLSEIGNIFNILRDVYSIIFLANLSKVNNDNFYYRLDGYKTVQKYFSFSKFCQGVIKKNDDSIFKIYQWVYKDLNNLTERMGMSRNIVSLHLENEDLLSLNKEVLPSIKSGYEIYLKENVDNYINILNQVVVLLNQLDQEAMKIADNFASKFKNNFISFITFFISTILLTTVADGDLSNIFTTEITIISIGFLCISFLYYIVSCIEFSKNIARLNQLYERNTAQYKIILNTEDLNRIFNIKNEEEEREEIKNLKSIRTYTSVLWIATLIILLVVILLSNINFYIPV